MFRLRNEKNNLESPTLTGGVHDNILSKFDTTFPILYTLKYKYKIKCRDGKDSDYDKTEFYLMDFGVLLRYSGDLAPN